jgi:DNA-dependent protein kinase catalytic subunit
MAFLEVRLVPFEKSRWINQIVAIVNRKESSVIEEKVIQIARHYPQALYYPFKVVESNLEVNVLEAEV